MDLPKEMLYGTSGLVTDSEGKERLMVCSDTGCFQRTEYGWEQGNTMLNNRQASLLVHWHLYPSWLTNNFDILENQLNYVGDLASSNLNFSAEEKI